MKNTRRITYSAFCAAFITICSWISIPIGAVPVTLQVFAIFFVALLFGRNISFYSTLIWLLLGLIGLPVFAGFSGGLSVLMGPTAGFIWAFLPAAYLCGYLGEKSATLGSIVAVLSLFLLIYPMGTWHLMRVTGLDLQHALAIAVYPFVVFDLIKVGLAYLFYGMVQRSGLSKLA